MPDSTRTAGLTLDPLELVHGMPALIGHDNLAVMLISDRLYANISGKAVAHWATSAEPGGDTYVQVNAHVVLGAESHQVQLAATYAPHGGPALLAVQSLFRPAVPYRTRRGKERTAPVSVQVRLHILSVPRVHYQAGVDAHSVLGALVPAAMSGDLHVVAGGLAVQVEL
jgi:hypothetical protein